MSKPAAPVDQGSPTRPYLIRALHDWCTDNGFTPYIAVYVDSSVTVPMEYVKNHEIVLNVGFEATTALKLGNEFIEFKARFGGVARDIVVERIVGQGRPRKPATDATGAAETLGADYALAVTGFTGPAEGKGGNAVGAIFIALHAPHGVWSKKLNYPGPRPTVKVRCEK